MSGNREYVNIGRSLFYQGGSRSQAEWEAGIEQLIEAEQYFLAIDLARAAVASFPNSLRLKQLASLASLRAGGVEEARSILEPLCPEIHANEARLTRIYTSMRKALGHAESDGADNPPNREILSAVQDLLSEIGTTGVRKRDTTDEETPGLLARVYKEIWERSGRADDCRRARDTYLYVFRVTGGIWTGINAATMSYCVGDAELSRDLAQEVLQICSGSTESADSEEEYWRQATTGEALLLLSNPEQATLAYRKAADLPRSRPFQRTSSLRQLKLLARRGVLVPEELLAMFQPPPIVVFTGHMMDALDRSESRFPAEKEEAVRAEIDNCLERMDAQIGYSSAACGSDIIFIEAMQGKGAETNIVLPFSMEDFASTSVARAGESWVRRFHEAVKHASSIKYVTDEPFLGEDALFGFGAQILHGHGALRGSVLETTTNLLAVWDGVESGLVGGTSSIVRQWTDRDKLHVIRIDKLGSDRPIALSSGRRIAAGTQKTDLRRTIEAPRGCERVIKTMLFADMKGYSKLEGRHIPIYMYEFLQNIAESLKDVDARPEIINTWGDAVFVVMSEATPLSEYALTLRDTVCSTDWTDIGLSKEMSIRIALHAGPVFQGDDPIAARRNVFGTHVNRAARMEPVTPPGNVYASEQFAALLMAEQASAERNAGDHRHIRRRLLVCDYVGIIALSKDFGEQPVYRIRKAYPSERVVG